MSWQLGLARLEAELDRTLQRAAKIAGAGEQLWQADRQTLARILRIDDDAAGGLDAIRQQFNPAVELARLAGEGISFTGLGEDGYPPHLAETFDPPFGLFTMGAALTTVCGDRPVIGVVGSRRPTAAGLTLARTISQGLAARGAVIVSGLALGTDAAAHQAAIDVAAPTIAVTGASPEIVNPLGNAAIRRDILDSGAVTSEYWPGTRPAAWQFPARNRIIAGLCHAVVVIEAGLRSGSLITADFALELGRPVLAVPHTPSPSAAGSNALLRAGALMCESANDVIAELSDLTWNTEPEGTPIG